MYHITCDGHPLLDLRDPDFILEAPRIKTEVNTVGEGSFTIYAGHPNYDKLKHLSAIFEVADENGVIFRGRMTEDTEDFYNRKAVDLEGAMAFFNDSVVREYTFPDDFEENADYLAEKNGGNVVRFYLNWLIQNHNAQVEPWQRFKLGNVTVTSPTNNIERASSDLPSTWNEIKSKLFESSLGGFLCIRYEEDGNYIDYLSEFTEINEQGISLDENLLDLSRNVNGEETYSAIIPRGAEVESEESTGEDYEGLYGTISGSATVKKRLTIEELPNGNITDDIVKRGDTLYSIKAVAAYGWRYAPREDTLWEDVTLPANLQSRGVEWLEGDATKLPSTIKVTAADLHFTDSQIRSFRIYKKIPVYTPAHGVNDNFDLTALDIPLLEPQNTKITVGKTVMTLTQIQAKQASNINNDIQKILVNYATNAQVAEGFKATEAQFLKTEESILSSVSGTYATKTELQETAASLMITDDEIVAAVSGTFATKDELGNYVTEDTVDTKISAAVGEIDLSVYATKTELQTTNNNISEIRADLDSIDLSVYASKEDVNGIVDEVEAKLELAVKTDKYGNLLSEINIRSNVLTIDTDNFSLSGDGTIAARRADITGTISAEDGNIGNWYFGTKLDDTLHTFTAGGISSQQSYGDTFLDHYKVHLTPQALVMQQTVAGTDRPQEAYLTWGAIFCYLYMEIMNHSDAFEGTDYGMDDGFMMPPA